MTRVVRPHPRSSRTIGSPVPALYRRGASSPRNRASVNERAESNTPCRTVSKSRLSLMRRLASFSRERHSRRPAISRSRSSGRSNSSPRRASRGHVPPPSRTHGLASTGAVTELSESLREVTENPSIHYALVICMVLHSPGSILDTHCRHRHRWNRTCSGGPGAPRDTRRSAFNASADGNYSRASFVSFVFSLFPK